jgi:hypothetical protein
MALRKSHLEERSVVCACPVFLYVGGGVIVVFIRLRAKKQAARSESGQADDADVKEDEEKLKNINEVRRPLLKRDIPVIV